MYCSLVVAIFIVLVVNFLMAVFTEFFHTLYTDTEIKRCLPAWSVWCV